MNSFASVGVDGDTHEMYVGCSGHDYRPRVTEVKCSGLRMGQAPCCSAQGRYIQGGCGGSIPLRQAQSRVRTGTLATRITVGRVRIV